MKYLALTAILTTLLSVTPAVAQSTSSERFREYSTSGIQYLNFSSNADLCNGQVLDNGLICVMDLPQEQLARRLAVLKLLYGESPVLRTLTTVQVFEIAPNEADTSYVVIIRDYIATTNSDVPRLRAAIRLDGSVSVDVEYGEYPPQFSAEEESRNMLERYEGEIRKLMAALVQAQ